MAEQFVTGRYYHRLCLRASWPDGHLKPQWWPVHGPMHEDWEFIGFGYQHYHVDWRFLNRRQRALALGDDTIAAVYNIPITAIVLSAEPFERAMLSERPQPDPLRHQYAQTKRRRRHAEPWPPSDAFRNARWYDRLTAAYRDQQLKPGLVCPHRGADLSGITPHDGIVTCPMHGLRWRADTGTLHIP